jgi:serine/threonine-protein kinase
VELSKGSIIADCFRLESPLGAGGMGAVWLARHLRLDIPCAVKFLHPAAAESPELRARFEREAKAAAQLRSPNVVQILDHGVWEGAPYIAMELLEGEDLEHRLRRVGCLSPRELVTIVSQIARALSRAHAAGLVHRDLKPANIFLVRDDDREIVKVLDFGVAKQLHTETDSKTQTGALMGTPFYMSPEQARGTKEVDHRTDLWALGVITFRGLLGRLPFESHALGDLFMLIINEPLPVPSKISAGIPPSFDTWWAQAAARPMEHRFASAKEMADALAIALGVTISADGNLAATGPSAPGADRRNLPGGVSEQTASAVAKEVSPAPLPKATRSLGLVAGAALLGALVLGGLYLTVRGRSSGDASSSVPELASALPSSRNAQAAPEPPFSSSAPAVPLLGSGSPAAPLSTSSGSTAPPLLPRPSAALTGAPRPGASAPLRGPLPGPATTKAPQNKPKVHDDGV